MLTTFKYEGGWHLKQNILSPTWMTHLAESSVLCNISQHSMWDNLTAPIHSNTLTRKVHILHDRHISLQGVNKFIPVIPFSNCELRENQCSKSHTLLMIGPYFLHFFVLFGLPSAIHVYKNVLSDCELHENRSESRTSPRGVDGIPTVLTFTYDVGEIWYNISAYNAAEHSQASRKSADGSSDLSLGRTKITFTCIPWHRDKLKVKHALGLCIMSRSAPSAILLQAGYLERLYSHREPQTLMSLAKQTYQTKHVLQQTSRWTWSLYKLTVRTSCKEHMKQYTHVSSSPNLR